MSLVEVAQVPSSDGRGCYIVSVETDRGEKVCSCKAYLFSRRNPKSCKHIESIPDERFAEIIDSALAEKRVIDMPLTEFGKMQKEQWSHVDQATANPGRLTSFQLQRIVDRLTSLVNELSYEKDEPHCSRARYEIAAAIAVLDSLRKERLPNDTD